MTTVEFSKMQGLGNDFIMLDDRRGAISAAVSYPDLAVRLCDRHFGIGGDGIILALESETHDIRYRIFNNDGSEPEMCGNGMRCFGKYLYEKRGMNQTKFRVETLAGTVIPELILDDSGQVTAVKVDMGEPILAPALIPFRGEGDTAVEVNIETQTGPVTATMVSMGNPHAVVFVTDIAAVDVEQQGRTLELHERFPEKTNVEFIQVMNDRELKMKVWERGAGITLACGTGACAALVAASLTHRTQNTATIHLDGGDLDITWDRDSNHIFKTGPAALVFDGHIHI